MSPNQRILLETRRFSVVEETVLRPDGQSASLKYVKHPGSVAILPLLSEERVCLIKSRRITIHKTILEVPAGTREPNEAPEETARRELAEETGYRTNDLQQLAVFYPSPGITDEQIWIYAARNLTEGAPAREPNEVIENHVVPRKDALEMVARGDIQDGKTILALLMYERLSRT